MGCAQVKVYGQNTSTKAQALRSQFKVHEGGNKLKDARIPDFSQDVRSYAKVDLYTYTYKSSSPNHQVQARLAIRPTGLVCVIAALFIAIAICVVSVMSSSAQSEKLAASIAETPASEYVVCSGDSLWTIASSHPMSGLNTSDVVAWIIERNGLEAGLIHPGQALMVPSQNG